MATDNTIRFAPASTLPTRAALAADELHLWLAPLELPDDQVAALHPVLSPDERDRADRFHFPRDRRRYIVAHAVLRALLGSYADRPPGSLTFGKGPQGKPHLEDSPEDLHFNMAHAGEHALYGFAGAALGVDVEVMRDDRDLLGLAERFFAPLERDMLRALPERDRCEGFYRAWTRKEAYIKALGRGLSEPLDGFAVSLRPGEPARLLRIERDPAAADAWHLLHLAPLPGLVGAVAQRRRPATVRAWALRPDACLPGGGL